MKTTGHTVLVTGGGSGIGFALASKFHLAGNRVIITGRSESTLADAVKRLPGAEFCVADVSNAQDRARLVSRFPEVTVLINNAGVRYGGLAMDQTEAEMMQELSVNVLAPVLLAQSFYPVLSQKAEAAIVNVTSGAALAPRDVAAMYAASKSALHIFTKSLRWQLEATSVRVFEVLPPVVRTAMTAFQGSHKGMITPDQLADEFWTNFQTNRFEMLIGKVKILHWLLRLSPALADRVVRKIPKAE